MFINFDHLLNCLLSLVLPLFNKFFDYSLSYLIFNQLIYSPVTYITTVGLYNDSNELLAVAKLSKPLQKDFTKESLIRVKLDY